MRVLRTNQQRGRRGAAAAEFALILPVFMLLVLGVIDFGRFAYDLIAVTNAARAGAAYGMMNNYSGSTQSAWQASIVAAATAEMSGQDGYSSSKLAVQTPTVTIDSNGLRRVTVEVRYTFNTIVTWPGIPSSTTLSRKAEVRLIR